MRKVGPRSKRYGPIATSALRPPIRGPFSNTWTLNPRLANSIADASPPGPAPTTITLFDVISNLYSQPIDAGRGQAHASSIGFEIIPPQIGDWMWMRSNQTVPDRDAALQQECHANYLSSPSTQGSHEPYFSSTSCTTSRRQPSVDSSKRSLRPQEPRAVSPAPSFARLEERVATYGQDTFSFS